MRHQMHDFTIIQTQANALGELGIGSSQTPASPSSNY